jgi:hypothetical protein
MSLLQPEEYYIGINPLPEMQRKDADVALMAIWLNVLKYETPVNDPLFSAHKESPYIPGGGWPNQTLYMSDNVAGVIGCTEQV